MFDEGGKGYITALVGENGAGKSTTFKSASRPYKAGWRRNHYLREKTLELTAKDRAKMGIVLTDSGFSGYLKVKDIIPVMESLYTEFEKSRFWICVISWIFLLINRLKSFQPE